MSTRRTELYAQLQSYLSNAKNVAQAIQELFGDRVMDRLDLDPSVDASSDYWNGMSDIRDDGAVRLQGFDKVLTESLAMDENSPEFSWAKNEAEKQPWFFIDDARAHPGLQGRVDAEAIRFQISTNVNYARFRQASWGASSAELPLLPFNAWKQTVAADGETPVQGEEITDASSIPSSFKQFVGIKATDGEKLARAMRARWIQSMSRVGTIRHNWGGVWTGQ